MVLLATVSNVTSIELAHGLVSAATTADTVRMTTRGAGAGAAARISLLTGAGQPTETDDAARARPPRPRWLLPLAVCSAALVLLANLRGIAVGDDGVGYRAIADSLLTGNGLGYFLDDPLTIWPPLWSALMALIAWATPLDTLGAAVVLNMATAVAVVYVGHGLLTRVVRGQRFVMLGTVMMGLGVSTVGFGHLLMTDLAFAVVVMIWLRCLIAFHDTLARRWIVLAAMTVWVGFALRYVALYLLVLGCGWLLFDLRHKFMRRLVTAFIYGAVGIVLPALWMLRNHGINGTFTGERTPSARGPFANAFDVLSTMGQWLLPGVADGALRLWAVVALVVLVVSAWLGFRILTTDAPRTALDTPLRRLVAWIGSPSGLLAVQAFGYLAYMVYVRSSTALNRLELRLLNPAYFSLVALALVLAANLARLDRTDSTTWARRGYAIVVVWAAANVAVGVFAAVSFATGDPFFEGNYESDVFHEVRDDPVLDALGKGCATYSNLPNALYPRVEAQWSPRRTALESTAGTDDLDTLADSASREKSCLVWIDEPPRYGHLWTREQLSEKVVLEELDRSGQVTVYRISPLR